MPLPQTIGRYQILGELATGGMAEILLGRLEGPSGFERPVVIKRILPHLARQESFVEMFLDEARIVGRIRHPNVVHVEELTRDASELILVMEYLEGESAAGLMKRSIARGVELDPLLAAHIVAEACAGLHAAHELTDAAGVKQNLVHRDVSPHNLFVTYGGQVKVLDFGVAKAADRTSRTEAGQIKGKFEYMSPEQCRNAPLDRRSDVFALGIVLYELTTGRRLFKRHSQLEVFRAISQEPVVPPSRLTNEYSPALEAICMRALALEPNDRYSSAAEMRRDLLSYLRSSPRLDDLAETLGAMMSELFADRIVEKSEMLRRVKRGEECVQLPAGEVDEAVDIPCIPDEVLASHTQLGSAVSTLQGNRLPSRRAASGLRTAVMAAVMLSLAVAGAAILRARDRRPAASRNDPPQSVAASLPAATPSSEVSASAVAPSASASTRESVRVHFETQPSGARVIIAGKDLGETPLDLDLARGARALSVDFRRAGFEKLTQQVTPDANQRIQLVLHPEKVRSGQPPAATASAAPATPASGKGFRRFD